MNILEEADSLINGDRLDTYEGTDDTIVALWSGYLGVDLTVLDYANMMILLKVARTKGQYHRDSYVDIAGYAGVGPRLWEEKLGVVDLDVPEVDYSINVSSVHEAMRVLRDLQPIDVPEDDSFFIQHMDQPVQPRVWDSLRNVPIGLKVTDKDYDIWEFHVIGGWTACGWNTARWEKEFPEFRTRYAPFTEVLYSDVVESERISSAESVENQ